ncbi:hypothetical protein GCM10017566_01580 [Amycolatopsis bartoniae]|uniref:Uncharacterized protein n=1 Tax=Amycolatopsis bartoniae TaxID=941986 RepID=A0A8H9MB46_9PSEU|nr:hypothetical protein GCM10017566_01580 [Amycolatopsis bartoniae]
MGADRDGGDYLAAVVTERDRDAAHASLEFLVDQRPPLGTDFVDPGHAVRPDAVGPSTCVKAAIMFAIPAVVTSPAVGRRRLRQVEKRAEVRRWGCAHYSSEMSSIHSWDIWNAALLTSTA